MSTAAAVVLVTSAGTLALKGAAPVALGGRELPPRLLSVMTLLGPAVLAALIVTNAFADGRTLALDARAAGLAAAACALALRAPLLVVVGAAALTAALLRLLT